ncbi:UNVERIFIED_CONTAM: Transposon TX1 uncharacterized protein [Sesamum radiatum]|uniref:Transposon TX1 uncharacterized protein n=1 Tax=Sesamum radiatum TaxID=300843 RepID=A0AAW2ILG7_SESRA
MRWRWFVDYAGPGNRIWVAWNDEFIDVDILNADSQFVHCRVHVHELHETVLLTVVYGANELSARRELWQGLIDLAITVGNEPWLVGGDFNAVLDMSEVSGASGDIRVAMNEFNDCILQTGLLPLPMQGERFTWHNCSLDGRSLWKRLDRLLVNDIWMERWPNLYYTCLTPRTSDHSPLVLKGDCRNMQVSLFRFDNYLALSPGFLASVHSIWRHPIVGFVGGDRTDRAIDLRYLRPWARHILTEDEARAIIRPVTTEEVKLLSLILRKTKPLGQMVSLRVSLKLHGRLWVKRCALKVDLRKAYDTVEWDFLIATLQMFGFPATFIRWIEECVTSAHYSVVVNGGVHGFFAGARGLRQGDPMSPYLFVLVMEVLHMILQQLIEQDGEFRYHWRCQDLKLFQLSFADDLILLCKADVRSVNLFSRGLDLFASLSGLHTNPQKSQLIISKAASGLRDSLLATLGFQEGLLPLRYLGLPLISARLSITDCQPLLQKIDSRIKGWEGVQISFAGRVQLIKSVLISFEVYWAMAFILPKGIIKEMIKRLRTFLWKGTSAYGYPKVAWENCEDGDLVDGNHGAVSATPAAVTTTERDAMIEDETEIENESHGDGPAAPTKHMTDEGDSTMEKLKTEFNIKEFFELASRVIDDGDAESKEMLNNLKNKWIKKLGGGFPWPEMADSGLFERGRRLRSQRRFLDQPGVFFEGLRLSKPPLSVRRRHWVPWSRTWSRRLGDRWRL